MFKNGYKNNGICAAYKNKYHLEIIGEFDDAMPNIAKDRLQDIFD